MSLCFWNSLEEALWEGHGKWSWVVGQYREKKLSGVFVHRLLDGILGKGQGTGHVLEQRTQFDSGQSQELLSSPHSGLCVPRQWTYHADVSLHCGADSKLPPLVCFRHTEEVSWGRYWAEVVGSLGHLHPMSCCMRSSPNSPSGFLSMQVLGGTGDV